MSSVTQLSFKWAHVSAAAVHFKNPQMKQAAFNIRRFLLFFLWSSSNYFSSPAFSFASIAQSELVPPAGKPSIHCSPPPSSLYHPPPHVSLCICFLSTSAGGSRPELLSSFSSLLHSSACISFPPTPFHPHLLFHLLYLCAAPTLDFSFDSQLLHICFCWHSHISSSLDLVHQFFLYSDLVLYFSLTAAGLCMRRGSG